MFHAHFLSLSPSHRAARLIPDVTSAARGGSLCSRSDIDWGAGASCSCMEFYGSPLFAVLTAAKLASSSSPENGQRTKTPWHGRHGRGGGISALTFLSARLACRPRGSGVRRSSSAKMNRRRIDFSTAINSFWLYSAAPRLGMCVCFSGCGLTRWILFHEVWINTLAFIL